MQIALEDSAVSCAEAFYLFHHVKEGQMSTESDE
jgi:hypothetical protein